MKKSFDQNIKSRLENYQSLPNDNLKAAVLGQLPVKLPWYSSGFRWIGVILVLLSIYQMGKSDEYHSSAVVINSPYPAQRIPIDIPGFSIKKTGRDIISEPNPSFTEPRSTDIYENDEYGRMDAKRSVERSFKTYSVVNKKPDFKIDILGERAIHLLSRNRKKEPIVQSQEKAFTPYYNVGSYFIYNRLQPNLNDDIYVGEYNSPFGLSFSRLGFLVEYGAEKQLSEKWTLRGGVSFNNYNQNYSFEVRNVKPDDVQASSTNIGFFEPVFETQAVEIEKRVSLVGVKAQAFWHVFPVKTTVLFFSAELQHLLGQGPILTYQNKEYALMRKNQFLMEAGLRKTIFDFKESRLYLMPSLRYGFYKFDQRSAISVKPFSVGVTFSLGF